MFKAAIFDLDGVVVDTVPLHFSAWKRMFSEYGVNFTFEDYKKKVDGIPRVDGARAILKGLSEEGIKKASNRKQKYFLQNIQKIQIPVHKTTLKLIKELRSKGIRIAIISSSKNCSLILNKTGLYPLIDVKVDGNDIIKGKPDPQIFLLACEKLGMEPGECIVFEDALLGVTAAKRARMKCVGIDRHNDPDRLRNADIIVKDLGEINYERLLQLFTKS